METLEKSLVVLLGIALSSIGMALIIGSYLIWSNLDAIVKQ